MSETKPTRVVVAAETVADQYAISDHGIEESGVRAGVRQHLIEAIIDYAKANGLDLADEIHLTWVCRAEAPAFRRPAFDYGDLPSQTRRELSERDIERWLTAIREAVRRGEHEVVIDLSPPTPAWEAP